MGEHNRRRGRRTVRTYLIGLVLACLLPGMLGALALFVHQWRQGRSELEKHTILMARALAQATDNHLMNVRAVARALSSSEALARGDHAAFHAQARQVLTHVGLGSSAVLRDEQGRAVIDTAVEWGLPLDSLPMPELVRGVFETGQSSVSDLIEGAGGRSFISVDVPVLVDMDLRYALGISVAPQQFDGVLRAQGLPVEWFAAVLDGHGRTVAGGSRGGAQDAPRALAPALLRQMGQSREGSAEFTTVDGVPVLAYFSRSPVTNWAVVVGIPVSAMVAGLARTSALLGVGVAALFAVGLLLARGLARRIGRSFQSLSEAAAGLGEGRRVAVPQMPIQEAADVALALGRAQDLLHERAATLRESEMRFKALADNIAQLAWMTDSSGRVLWFNRRWYEYTGATPDDTKGGWLRYHHPDHMDRTLGKFSRHVESGDPWEDTFPIRGREGHYRWFLSRAFPLRDSGGRIVSWFGTNTDITEQLEAQRALHEADRRKDEFIALLAHELRNPLAPVRTAVEILRRIGNHEPRTDRARDVIDRQVTHMSRLVDDLLDVSRIARGKLALRKERCDLGAVARQIADDYRPSLEAAGLRLHVRIAPQPIWVDGDPVRLAQMIGNLLTNAARFTERGGQVEVHAETDTQRRLAIVRVVDTGVGMDPELMERLFDPFSQARQDLARSKGGLGLGLALTKGLVELHGGGVAVDSDGPGRGSTFALRLPLAGAAKRPTAVPAVTTKSPRGGGLRVLVIEDNEDAARSLGELLEMNGHRVRIAYDGESGIQMAREFRPDVVISDIGLPGEIDGYGVAQALRADAAVRDAYLIALSGYANEQARRRSAAAGFDVHFPKPADIQMLERTLASI